MIEEQIIKRGIKDKRVLEAMSNVHRELFVPKNLQQLAHEDLPLSIGYGQTISQPFIVAFMTEAAMLEPNAKVLEIGTGCGYQTAILSNLCKEVYTIEVLKPLGEKTKKRLEQLNYNNVHVLIGDGYEGWPSASPFDAIIVTAAPENIPQTLVDQLKNDISANAFIAKSQSVSNVNSTTNTATQVNAENVNNNLGSLPK